MTAAKERLIQVRCALCKDEKAGVYRSKDRKGSLYLRCPYCNSLTFGHEAVVAYVEKVRKQMGNDVQFEAMSLRDWNVEVHAISIFNLRQ